METSLPQSSSNHTKKSIERLRNNELLKEKFQVVHVVFMCVCVLVDFQQTHAISSKAFEL
jgi:hypothetical protein